MLFPPSDDGDGAERDVVGEFEGNGVGEGEGSCVGIWVGCDVGCVAGGAIVGSWKGVGDTFVGVVAGEGTGDMVVGIGVVGWVDVGAEAWDKVGEEEDSCDDGCSTVRSADGSDVRPLVGFAVGGNGVGEGVGNADSGGLDQ